MALIEETWRRIEEGFASRGLSYHKILHAREAFVAGVHIAAAAMIAENAGIQDIIDAAERLERRR